MIIDIILFIFGSMIGWVASILPTFTVYPPAMIDGIAFFGQKIAGLNFFVFDIPKILVIFTTLIIFETNYFIAVKIASLINFFRGSGKLEL